MNSGIYVGSVRHRRFTPVQHSFVYPFFMPLIDLDELDELSQTIRCFGKTWLNVARFHREDYLQGQQSLQQSIRDKVEQLSGKRIKGKILMLCQLRYCGFYFSPLNLYYLYDAKNQWRYLLAEVSNTPWNERHYYLIPAVSGQRDTQWTHNKAFHVSPFNPMEQQYQWRINEPGKNLLVHLESHTAKDNKVFDATLALQRQPFTSAVLLKQLIKTPMLTAKVVFSIYWQTLKLWLKGVPFYSHPGKRAVSVQGSGGSELVAHSNIADKPDTAVKGENHVKK